MDREKLAIEAYRQIMMALKEIEYDFDEQLYIDPPDSIEIDGEIFLYEDVVMKSRGAKTCSRKEVDDV